MKFQKELPEKGISLISTHLIKTYLQVLRRLEIPGAIENNPFVNGSLKFLGIKIDENCPIIETEISDLTNLFPDLKTVIVGLQRGNEMIIPKSNEKLIIGDIAYLVCPSELSRRAVSIFGHPEKEARKVVLVGVAGLNLNRSDFLLVSHSTSHSLS